jgi:hypothetical protein
MDTARAGPSASPAGPGYMTVTVESTTVALASESGLPSQVAAYLFRRTPLAAG